MNYALTEVLVVDSSFPLMHSSEYEWKFDSKHGTEDVHISKFHKISSKITTSE